jgi:hypothetical protein
MNIGIPLSENNLETIELNSPFLQETVINSDNISDNEQNSEEKSTDTLSKKFLESLNPKIKLMDTDDNVHLFCYTSCSDNDPYYIKNCRGLVFKGNELVLKAYSYNPIYTIDDYDTIINLYPFLNNHVQGISKYNLFESYEGSLLRVFHVNNESNEENRQGKWYVSTHKRLDAFKSKWSSKISFGSAFLKALEYEYSTNDNFKNRILTTSFDNNKTILENFLSTLDTNYQYVFLLQNSSENRIVCKANQYPKVYHVGTFTSPSSDKIVNLSLKEIDVNLPVPVKYSFDTLNDMFKYVESIDIYKIQGLIMFTENEQIKFMNKEYKHFFDLRGNESSLKYRYLQVRMNPIMKNEYINLYPEYQNSFDLYENTLYDIAVKILNAYINRFINKQFVTVPPEEFSILKLCHAWYMSDRMTNHISFEKVMSVLNDQPTTKLNRMIKRNLTSSNTK